MVGHQRMQSTLDIGFAHDRTTGKEDWLTPPEILRARTHWRDIAEILIACALIAAAILWPWA